MMKNNEIIQRVRDFVENECVKNDNGFCEHWLIHLDSVASNAVELAKKIGADEEVVELAALFHDIGTITNRKEDHHITGAKIAEEKLREFGYPEEKIVMVKHCVYSHRASKKIPKETLEAEIVADADAIAHFGDIGLLLRAERVFAKIENEEEANEKIKAKLLRSWEKLSDSGKDYLKAKGPMSLEIIK